MEWKKVKFMQDRVGEDFDGLIISVTKFGFFVELTDLFVEGLVPLATLTDDRYTYHENTREIIGQRSRKTYRLGRQVRVMVDRIDPVEKKIQFAAAGGSSRAPKLGKEIIAKGQRLRVRIGTSCATFESQILPRWCKILSQPHRWTCRGSYQSGRGSAW